MSPDASWTFQPGVLAAVVLAAMVYTRRWRHAREVAGPRGASGWRLASFMAGLLTILAVLVSPIDRLADQLFTMHMVQHMLLLDVASILLVLGFTKVILRPATSHLAPMERAAGPLGHPAFAVVLYILVMWAWHVPAFYSAAVRHSGVHVFEHLCFAVAGTLYWWHLIGPVRSRLRGGPMSSVAYMVVTKLAVGLLGVGLAFAPGELYSVYADQPNWWGLTPSQDQSVAGLVMALEQSIVMGIALTVLFARALSESEAQEQRAERYAAS